jgi:hypothetical protein
MDVRGCIAFVAFAAVLAGHLIVSAQTAQKPAPTTQKPSQTTQKPRSTAKPKPAPPPVALKTEPATVTCPTLLGTGAKTGLMFCDVLIGGNDPASGVIVALPPHTGEVTLSFDLHNRHTYSEEQIRSKRAYHRYTASIGVFALDNTLLGRAVVQSEFRNASDLVDRVLGGSGPGGLKAVAPTGTESIVMTIEEMAASVAIVGEKLTVVRLDGKDDFTTAGRPIAVISNVMLEYRPGPPPRPARGK